MPLDGSTPPTPISSGPEDEFQPAYSPDGKFVAFHAVRTGGVRDVYLVPAEGGSRTRVPLATTNNLVPRFSPDGRSLLYTVWGDDGSSTCSTETTPGSTTTSSAQTRSSSELASSTATAAAGSRTPTWSRATSDLSAVRVEPITGVRRRTSGWRGLATKEETVLAIACAGILGWLLMLPGAPISAIPGWLLGRRLAQQL